MATVVEDTSASGVGDRSPWWTWPVILVVVAVGTALLIVILDPITLRRWARLIALSLAVLGVVVATGRVGLVSLGHGAFVGVGAFSAAYFLDQLHWPFALAILGAFFVSAVSGLVVGLPALRVRGLRLAMVTLAVAVVFPLLAKQFPKLTGGPVGKPINARMYAPVWLPFDDDLAWRFIVCVVVVVIGFWITKNLFDSRVGRAMQAVRDDQTAAAAYGINIATLKVTAFSFSAGLAGVAGALQIILFPFVSQADFDLLFSLRLYAAAVVGGLASVLGALVGVLALIVVPRINEVVDLLSNETLVFGIGLVVLTFIAPDGIVGAVSQLWGKRKRGSGN
jgi:branched-chain amino acid transport system permease protein